MLIRMNNTHQKVRNMDRCGDYVSRDLVGK